MAEVFNLPVVQSQLIDGGLVVQNQVVTSDPMVVIGFEATGGPSNGAYVNIPILMTSQDAAGSVYGPASSGCSLSRAVYEAWGAGANQVYAMSLGPWGTATYTDQTTGIVSPIFSGGWASTVANAYAHSQIALSGYYLALENAYNLLAGAHMKIVHPVDAYAFDSVTLGNAPNRPTNFAYQLAANLYDLSTQFNECTGTINVQPALSGTLPYIATYVGTAPVKDAFGNINQNGTGLLGQTYMAGSSGLATSTVNPGFWLTTFATTSPSLYHLPPIAPQEIATDQKGNWVDIGKYMSIVAEEPQLTNGAYQVGGNFATVTVSGSTNSYFGQGAATYAAFYSTLVPQSGPTNKTLPPMVTGLRYYKSLSQLDALDGARYVTFRTSARGIVVTDDPLASRPTSDYKWLSTMRIVNATLNLSRQAAEPFIGEGNTAANRNALQTNLDKLYKNMVKAGALQNYSFSVTASPADQVLGNMWVNLTLVPAFETKKINLVVQLAPSIANAGQ